MTTTITIIMIMVITTTTMTITIITTTTKTIMKTTTTTTKTTTTRMIMSKLVVYKKAYDISREGSQPHTTSRQQQHHKITNHKVNLLYTFIQLFEYFKILLFF